jgi:hypothetical protein
MGRESPIAWAVIAVLCLGAALLTAPADAGWVAVLVAALLLTLLGAVVALVRVDALGWRWAVMSLVAAGWGGVCFLAGRSMFGAGPGPDFVTGMVLAGAAVGMAGILALLARRPQV